MAELRVTQVRSLVGANRKAAESVRSLGLKRIHRSVVVGDTPQVRGYIQKARHLLTVEQADATTGTKVTKK